MSPNHLKPVCFSTIVIVIFLAGPVFASARQSFDQAIAFEKSGELDRAVAAIAAAIQEEPGNDLYLATAGHLEYNRGRHEDALAHAIAALKINSVGWYNVVAAQAAFASGKLSESRAFAQAACDVGKAALGQANYETAGEILHQSDPYQIKLSWLIPSDHLIRRGNSYAVTVAVPLSDLPYQKTAVKVKGARVSRDYLKDGNHLLDLLSDSPQVELVTEISRTPLDQSAALSADASAIPDEAKPYLGSSQKVNVNSAVLKTIAAAQKGATPVETVRNILRWMNHNLKYAVSDFSDAEEVAKRGYGECWGWSSVFTALCRLNGIPARNVWGMVSAPGFAPDGYLKGHTWAEFYLAGSGWIQLEPQFPGLLGTIPSHYLRVAHSSIEEGWGAVMNLPDTAQIIERRR
jgi:tetratricopeptide (TPR) repeat protein